MLSIFQTAYRVTSLYNIEKDGTISVNKEIFLDYIEWRSPRLTVELLDVFCDFYKDGYTHMLDPDSFLDLEYWKTKKLLELYELGLFPHNMDNRLITLIRKFKNKKLFNLIWIFIAPLIDKSVAEGMEQNRDIGESTRHLILGEKVYIGLEYLADQKNYPNSRLDKKECYKAMEEIRKALYCGTIY